MAPRDSRRISASAGSLALNRAFVFVKPHAYFDAVKDLVRTTLKAKEVEVVKEGVITAEEIDRDMLIDKHYYAIASKATLLKPEKLPVPEGKFKDKFGLEWADALKSGAALNAKEACERFGVDAAGLMKLWNEAKDAGQFTKFSGGFYCAKIDVADKGTFYVFNGFFMNMRNKYVAAGAAIHYFCVEWSPLDVSWSDFRTKVLGPTDPTAAPEDSIRGQIFAKWQELGLSEVPNISDNGVHASASPIEALFERMNWLGVEMQDDVFGATLVDHDITPELIEDWRRDPQISYGHGAAKKKGSLYDALEDLDVDRCTILCQDIANCGRTHATVQKNRAFVFIKPHAVTQKVKDLVKKTFEDRKMRIMQEGVVEASTIDEDMLVDKHYYAIASKATLLTPDKLPVPADKFKKKFNVEWSEALETGKAFNAKDACDKKGISPDELGALWKAAGAAGDLIKFSGGFYCAKITKEGVDPFYVLNGFFMEMRGKFVKKGAEIYYYVVDWDPVQLSWSDFRGEVLGPTDPSKAPESSIRGTIMKNWQELGLSAVPNMQDNGVHASASPIEALFERMNWLDTRLEKDPFGKILLQDGVSTEQVAEWSKDPQVLYGFGPTKGSFYDCLEDKDTDACLEECLVIARSGHTPTVVRNSALVFIKPHANTDKTKELVKQHMISKELQIVDEGEIDGKVIDQKMLIDKHYYAIASKATLVTPEQLPVPEDKFKEFFGLEWKDALAGGNVLNAKQACERLKLNATSLGEKWIEAKKAGLLVKFGGGFYCAKFDDDFGEGKNVYYVFNGFFMSMRDKYVADGASIYYYLVEWDPLDLSWSDFRGKVLGSTDPATAPEDSLRAKILHQYEELGLKKEPDISDNGVHASASPFEALSERMNWVGRKVEDDAFGQLLLHSGVELSHIEEWSLDPRVTFTSHHHEVTKSLYDALEDLDADRCVTQCQLIVGSTEATAGATLEGEAAEKLQKEGTTVHQTSIDTYESYCFKYFVEEAGKKGSLWEVTREQKKMSDGMYSEETNWSARKLNHAEVQQVMQSSAKDRRSPLNNRLPADAKAQD